MIDLSAVGSRTLVGRALRAPLGLIPEGFVVPVLQGPLRGAKWTVGSSTHGCWLGCYEVAKQKVCLTQVRRGSIAYDLGAHVGFYTLLFSRLAGKSGAVHAFEPSERNLAFLRRHAAMNRATNVRIHPVAVGRTTGLAAFDPIPGPSMGRIIDECGPSAVRVPLIALDDFVYAEGHAPPDLVKMDVEGGEVDVLAGMQRILMEKRPVLLVAIHGPDRWAECRRALGYAGYSIRDLAGRPIAPGIEPDEIIAMAKGVILP